MFNLIADLRLIMLECLHRFRRDNFGVTSIEYGLMAVSMSVLVVLVAFGDSSFIGALKVKYQVLTTSISNALLSLSK